MTKEQFIIDIVSKHYDINLCTPYAVRKEAISICAYMLRRNTKLKHVAISITLGCSAKSTNLIGSIAKVRNKRQVDEKFNEEMSEMERKIARYTLVHMMNKYA
jgi:hypothetical protein